MKASSGQAFICHSLNNCFEPPKFVVEARGGFWTFVVTNVRHNSVDSVALAREWRYNHRSELVGATLGTARYGYAYDSVGNRLWSSAHAVTNAYAANSLNQYISLLRGSATPCEIMYDADGNLTNDGRFVYAYDAENRLVSVYPVNSVQGSLAVENRYDHRNRRIRKIVKRYNGSNWQINETHTFVWDGNNIVFEQVAFANGTSRTFEYFWGADKSGSEQGAGGVEGLLAVSMDGVFTIPCYDHNGNIILYISETGSIAAQYTYDPYGNVIDTYGNLADVFSFGFSTKYHDRETGMIGYQRRFYRPDLGRWLNRDPIEESGGENLYAFCNNSPLLLFDPLGWRTYKLGWHGEPNINFDNDFPYDPNAEASFGDYWNWVKWKTKLNVARLIGHLEDGTLMYQHYLEGTGTPMTFDYIKAYREDTGIAASVRNAVREAQREAERLAKTGGREFKMSSDVGNADRYPTTENWQKAIGGHSLWGEAQVYNCKDKFSMQITIHAIDRYNFNKGASDIATGAPDNENGRFEVLGWAKSFTTRGSIPIAVDWKRGSVGEMEVGSNRRWSIGRSRARGR